MNFLGRLKWCGKIVGLTDVLQQFVDIHVGGVQRLLYIVTFYEHPSTNVESI